MAWFITLGVIAIIIFCIVVFGRNSERSGIRDDSARVTRIRTSTGRLRRSNNRTAKGIKRAKERADNISANNKTAKSGIRTALDILKKAKKRSDDKGS